MKKNEPKYPIFFTDRTCIHCGGDNTVTMINKFGSPAKNDFYPIHTMECSKCGRQYFIRWDDEGEEKVAVAVSKDDIKIFTKILENTVGFSQ